MTQVLVPYGKKPSETATLLLAAAEESGQDAGVVRTGSYGSFIVDEALAKKAGVDYEKGEVDDPEITEINATTDDSASTKAVEEAAADAHAEQPAKKTAAKKTTAKKTAAKKTTAKKTAAKKS